MTSKPPPGKGGKPFLGEDDLMSELDAWDATFDALHGGPEASASPGPQPMEWPAAPEVAIDPTTLSRAAPSSLDDDDDRQMTLDSSLTIDGSVEADGSGDTFDTFGDPPDPAEEIARALDVDPLETDFSGVGASGRPRTLGDMLGPTPDPTASPSKHGAASR